MKTQRVRLLLLTTVAAAGFVAGQLSGIDNAQADAGSALSKLSDRVRAL
ncbi:MAG: hypothetical protein R3E48_01945 [Burkholderiaceae bacterium]